MKYAMPIITITDMDDTHYVLLTDEDIERMFESKPDMTEHEMFKELMSILSHRWVPAMELDGTRILLNTGCIKKVGAKKGMVAVKRFAEKEEDEDEEED